MFSFILHLYLYMQAVCMWLIRVQLIVHMQVSAMITVVDIANPPTTKGPLANITSQWPFGCQGALI